MSKDPAVLFYTSDFISGTLTMSDSQRGQYILLLCLQHQQGFLTEEDMLNICKTYDAKVFSKFTKAEDGLYYNQRMKDETDRRQKYSESRRSNRIICKSYDKHMETEAETITEDKDLTDYNGIIESYHLLCPKMSKVLSLNKERKGFVKSRLMEFGIDKINEVLVKAGQSDFMNGINDRAWKADFEWIMRPTNFLKILEGKYDNQAKTIKSTVDPYIAKKYGI